MFKWKNAENQSLSILCLGDRITPRICAKGIRMRVDFDDGHGVNLQGRGYNL